MQNTDGSGYNVPVLSILTDGTIRAGMVDSGGVLRQIGSANNVPAEYAWRYRDYVIRALNADKPFDEFVREQIAGDLLNAAGNQAAAEQHYRQAIVIAERQSAKLFQLRASTSLARLWRDQGKRMEARDLLAPIYGWFTEGFDAPDLKEAKALLDELA